MNKGLILHAALLLANIGVFVGMAGGSGSGDGRASQADWLRPVSRGNLGSELAATLETLKKEQAHLRDELAKIKSPVDMRQASSAQQAGPGGHCQNAAGDNAPGVTVYLETTPPEGSQTNGRQPGRQWTSVSFNEIGQAPDGSKQAVMSIQKTEVSNGPVEFIPARAASRWQ